MDKLEELALQVRPEAATEVFCKKRSSEKFHKIHRKTPVPESFLIKLQT